MNKIHLLYIIIIITTILVVVSYSIGHYIGVEQGFNCGIQYTYDNLVYHINVDREEYLIKCLE